MTPKLPPTKQASACSTRVNPAFSEASRRDQPPAREQPALASHSELIWRPWSTRMATLEFAAEFDAQSLECCFQPKSKPRNPIIRLRA